jgi:hypothetical protein
VDLERGFQIEAPAAFVPWAITERRLSELLPASHGEGRKPFIRNLRRPVRN